MFAGGGLRPEGLPGAGQGAEGGLRQPPTPLSLSGARPNSAEAASHAGARRAVGCNPEP